MNKKQIIAVSLVSFLLGLWFTVASLFLTLNYVETKSDLAQFEFGLPLPYLTQDCESFRQESLPVTLGICDPSKYTIHVLPLALATDLLINIGVPFGIITVIVLFGNARYRKKQKQKQ